MNILYLCTRGLTNKTGKGYCTYYNDIVVQLMKKHNVTFSSRRINRLSQITRKKIDIVMIGFGYTNTGSKNPSELHGLKINDIKIPVIIILNKEYDAIDKKLDWVKTMNPKAIMTVHHDYDEYQKITKIPCHRIMWSINGDHFRDRGGNYKYDIFYSGVIRKEQTGNFRRTITDKLKKLEKYKSLINARYEEHNYKGNIIGPEEYAKNLSDSKICFTTTSAGDLVNPRFFEAMATNRSMILCNRMDKLVYEEMLIDGFNCIMFDTVEDFFEKFEYYIQNEEERIKIVNQAYEYFNKSQKWEHRINNITEILNKYVN